MSEGRGYVVVHDELAPCDPEEWLRHRARQRVRRLRSERRRLVALVLIPVGLLGLALAPRLLAVGHWGAPIIAAQARPRAAALPPSKQSAPARPRTWLCGTVRTGGVSSPLMLTGTGELRLDLDQPAVVELRLQDRPCGAAR